MHDVKEDHTCDYDNVKLWDLKCHGQSDLNTYHSITPFTGS